MKKSAKLTLALGTAILLAIPNVPGFDGTAKAASINLGGVTIRLPSVNNNRKRRSTTQSSRYASHARWHVLVQDTHSFATNNEGIWIGYDDAGGMVLQLELGVPDAYEAGTVLPVQVMVNGRLYATIQGAVAENGLVVTRGAEVEQILARLMSGRDIVMSAAGASVATHLKGSSAAIRQVRSAAALQRRLYAEGKINVQKPDKKKSDENAISYFLPGIAESGKVDVRFDIVESTGLVLYMLFEEIRGQGDPAHTIPLTRSETERTIAFLRKSEQWTEVARSNRVGLFSKRLGFIDDSNGDPVPLDTAVGNEARSDAGAATGSEMDGNTEEQQGSGTIGVTPASEATKPAAKASGPSQVQDAGEPKNFVAANFNSYEDGTTSVQMEHSVEGFSRRFNLSIADALKLAETLEATLEYASFKLEKRGFDLEEKDKLFK